MTYQPEAIRIADGLDQNVQIDPQTSEDEPGGYRSELDELMADAASILRSQHARIAELEAENQTLREKNGLLKYALTEHETLQAENAELEAMLDAVGAGGVGQSIKPPVQADTAQKPVAWQRRMRQDWVTEKDCWGPWEDCTQAQADDYKQTPVLHDQWVYESRALYTAPQAASQPLTDEQIWGNDRIMGANSKLGLLMKDLALLVRAVEQAHGIGGQQ